MFHLPRALNLHAALAVLASRCVSAMNARNYVPQNAAVDQHYYGCLRASQQDYAYARYGAYADAYAYSAAGRAGAGRETNVTLLKSCMGAQSYSKRLPPPARTSSAGHGPALAPHLHRRHGRGRQLLLGSVILDPCST